MLTAMARTIKLDPDFAHLYDTMCQLNLVMLDPYNGSFVEGPLPNVCPVSKVKIKYSEWAWSMRVILEYYGRDVDPTFLSIFYDFVYSVWCGHAAAPVPQSRIQKYQSKFRSSNVTYEDAWEISDEFYDTFAHIPELDWAPVTALNNETAFKHILSREWYTNQKRVIPSRTDQQVTLEAMKAQMWKDARSAYFKLRIEGHDVYDFDVVFHNEEQPFHNNAIYMDLAGRIEEHCGFLPVGNLKEGVFLDPKPVHLLSDMIDQEGMFQSVWQKRYEKNPKILDQGVKVAGKGLINVKNTPSKSRRQDFLKMFPTATKLPPNLLKHVIDTYDQCGVCDPSLIKKLTDYKQTQLYMEYITTCTKDASSGRMSETKFSLNDGVYPIVPHTLVTFPDPRMCFEPSDIRLDDTTGLSSVPETDKTDSSISWHIDRLQKAKLLLFYEKMFTKYKGKAEPDYGLFLEACSDYANHVDPLSKKTPENWVLWRSSNQTSHDLIIYDNNLFSYKPTAVNEVITMGGQRYQATAKGFVCYMYSPLGEPLLRTAYLCPYSDYNYLDLQCIETLRGAFHREYQTGCLFLPQISLDAGFGGEPQMKWAEREIGKVDISYWHKALGHVSEETLKGYIPKIKGMPPFFWPFKIYCKECNLS